MCGLAEGKPNVVFLFGENMNLPLPSNAMDFYLNPWEWLASNFSFQYHSWIKHYENKGNDNQLKNLLIIRQILLAST